MGLCKCPQRKVTNIFCYEHRVNVCEQCLMNNHPKCVVDTYKNWITDSEYTTLCVLCNQQLADNETIRLLCLDLVHWDCLDGWARSLPPTTAPAGYKCPVCREMCVFPAHNQVSPIADALRAKMNNVNWARIGLGLPLLENEPPPAKSFLLNGHGTTVNGVTDSGDDRSETLSEHGYGYPSQSQNQWTGNKFAGGYQEGLSSSTPHPHSSKSDSYNRLADSFSPPPQVPAPYPATPNLGMAATTRKSMKFDLETPLIIDEDDNKYHRRSPFESLSRWLRQVNPANKRRNRRRTFIYVIGTFIGIIILMMLFFGRNADYEDDTFNLRANPHVLVGEGKVLAHDYES